VTQYVVVIIPRYLVLLLIFQKAKDAPKTATVDLMAEFSKETAAPALRGRAGLLKGIERKIQRYKTRSLNHPKRPAKFEELESIPDQFKTTFDGDKFLIFNKVIGGHQSSVEAESTQEPTQASSSSSGKCLRMIGYSSNFGLHLLRQAEVWSADGTFSVTPAPFYQLYTILAHLEGYAYPAAFVFMPGKKRFMYKVRAIDLYFINCYDCVWVCSSPDSAVGFDFHDHVSANL
jgi:hypothetical protein